MMNIHARLQLLANRRRLLIAERNRKLLLYPSRNEKEEIIEVYKGHIYDVESQIAKWGILDMNKKPNGNILNQIYSNIKTDEAILERKKPHLNRMKELEAQTRAFGGKEAKLEANKFLSLIHQEKIHISQIEKNLAFLNEHLKELTEGTRGLEYFHKKTSSLSRSRSTR